MIRDFVDRPMVTCVAAASADELLAELEGVRTLHLDGADVVDKSTFLAGVERDLPMPADLRPGNWDALADVLWGSFARSDESEVAIVWDDAHVLLDASLSVFLQALAILVGFARTAATTETGFPREMVVRLFLVGAGDNFDGGGVTFT